MVDLFRPPKACPLRPPRAYPLPATKGSPSLSVPPSGHLRLAPFRPIKACPLLATTGFPPSSQQRLAPFRSPTACPLPACTLSATKGLSSSRLTFVLVVDHYGLGSQCPLVTRLMSGNCVRISQLHISCQKHMGGIIHFLPVISHQSL